MKKTLRTPLVAGSVFLLTVVLALLLLAYVFGPASGFALFLCLPFLPFVAALIIRRIEPGSPASVLRFCIIAWVGIGLLFPTIYLFMGMTETRPDTAFLLSCLAGAAILFTSAAVGSRQ